jgi:hypothetical protein
MLADRVAAIRKEASGEQEWDCEATHTQIAHTFVCCSRIRREQPIRGRAKKHFLAGFGAAHMASSLPTMIARDASKGPPTSHGSTYIEIHISPPCSNPRIRLGSPPGRFLLWGHTGSRSQEA